MIIWTGKAIGAVLGFLMGGPVGALLGLILGQYFDVARASTLRPLGRKSSAHHAQSAAQQAFFEATFSVMGHIAKADGRVSENEINAARTVMRNMMLSEKMKKQAITFFTHGKSPGFKLDDEIGTLLRYCGR
ncbi:MAG: TerB family tellurite resistance protein, partial [Cyanobacteria bacterium]|nr:TerB family tellurite resistance protein [Cyanobacteriota bacterium]